MPPAKIPVSLVRSFRASSPTPERAPPSSLTRTFRTAWIAGRQGRQQLRRTRAFRHLLQGRRRKYHNGEAVEVFYEPNAITDGDTIVHFRRADVIVAGDIFTTTQYPFIDVKNGGSVQGEIAALNNILDKTVYEHDEEGGTLVIPGHGRLCDEWEVTDYRDMVAIIPERVGDDQERRFP